MCSRSQEAAKTTIREERFAIRKGTHFASCTKLTFIFKLFALAGFASTASFVARSGTGRMLHTHFRDVFIYSRYWERQGIRTLQCLLCPLQCLKDKLILKSIQQAFDITGHNSSDISIGSSVGTER